MASHITMKRLQQGPRTTLLFTFCSKSIGMPAVTETININNLALLRFKFSHVQKNSYSLNMLESCVMLKKNEKTNLSLSTVKVSLTCEKFEKQWICSDDWATIEMEPKQREVCESNVILSTLEVNIIVHEIKTIALQTSKLYEDIDLTDFHLCTKDGKVAVHKALLAMHSDMFLTMFRGDWKETLEGNITIDGVTVQTLEHLKKYIYLGILPEQGLEPLLQVAVRYFMDKLRAVCIAKLVKTVKPENLNELIELACQNNIPDLMRAILFHTPNGIVNEAYQLTIAEDSNEENKWCTF